MLWGLQYNMRVWTEAYGCTLNQGETMMVTGMALEAGHTAVDSPEEADIIIIGTCVVIDHTERRMWERLKELQDKKVVVVGCLPQVFEERLGKVLPNAMVVPPGKMEEAAVFFSMDSNAEIEHLEPAMDGICATIPISTGCLGSCAYCITRVARGKLCSREPEEIQHMVKRALDLGAREIRITSQDTGAYGHDKGMTISAILDMLESLEPIFFTRLGMMNPLSLEPVLHRVADFLAGNKAYRFLHVPLQSGSNKMLEAMGRGYSMEQAVEMIEEIRRRVPDLTFSTDIIVGFPGETQEDHEMTIALLRRLQPDIVNITRFSPRPGTPAMKMLPTVPGAVTKERSRDITKTRFEIARRKKAMLKGKVVEALVTGNTSQGSAARTRSYTPLVLETSHKPGDIVQARITSTHTVHVVGEAL